MASCPVLCVCGKKNSGKTTLLEKLIAELTGRGLRVATVKHDRHGFEMDVEGKDTWRHKRAGAVATMISGPGMLGMVRDVEREPSLLELAELVADGADLVLAEGFKTSDQPKLEVVRAERSREAICGPGDDLIGVATDVKELDIGVPRFGLDEVVLLAEHIMTWLEERR